MNFLSYWDESKKDDKGVHHELIEPNHTPRFWNIVSVQVPRYKEAKQWLREQGHELEVDF